MKKVLFLIHDLGSGGAEKVLVNLVNNMDYTKFDISVTVLFGGGVNEQFLNPEIHFKAIYPKMIPGNSKLMKLLTPKQLHKVCVKEKYDIEISYLEGPSARIISGCENKETKLVSWIHSNHFSLGQVSDPFRNSCEAIKCYQKFDKIVSVSQYMKINFMNWIPEIKEKSEVLYNVVESERIIEKALEDQSDISHDEYVNLIAVGTFKEVKGYDRLLRIIKKFKDEGLLVRLYLLGRGSLESDYKRYVKENNLQKEIIFLGYQTNPYKYVRNCDLFVCSSHSEGFSTAATEALIVGTPVCTVEVSGMRELLGSNNEYGVVTDNNEEALYIGIKELIKNNDKMKLYRKKAYMRGKHFCTENTVKAVEKMLLDL